MRFRNKSKYILIVAIICLLIGLGGVVLSARLGQFPKSSKKNDYHFSSTTIQPVNMKQYTNENLKKSHCLDDICIENVNFYYTDEGGRIEYTIENRTNRIVSGSMKLVFENQSLTAIYNQLAPNSRLRTSSYFSKMQIYNKEDYTLRYLTEEEKSKIVVKEK